MWIVLPEYSSKYTNFAYDTNFYECSKSYDDVTKKLGIRIEKLRDWYYKNNLKYASHHTKQWKKTQGNSTKESSKSKILLGVTADRNFHLILVTQIYVVKQVKRFMLYLGQRAIWHLIKNEHF